MKKNKGGRPSEYKPEYCKKLIAHMSEGLSYESFAGLIGTKKQTLYNWEEKHPEFLDAKEQGVDACRLYWEKVGRDNVISTSDSEYQGGSSSRSLNAAVYRLNMQNRFGWKEKQGVELTGKDGAPIEYTNLTDEQLDARIQALKDKAK